MAEITSIDLDADHWATSDGVRDHIDIPTKGGSTDVEGAIESATDTVQAWWKQATDGDIPADLPPTDSSDPNQIETENSLLVRATELLAASEKHESNAQNIRSDSEADRKHVFLEQRAESKFENWVTVSGHGVTDKTEAQDSGPSSTGRSSSLIDLGGN